MVQFRLIGSAGDLFKQRPWPAVEKYFRGFFLEASARHLSLKGMKPILPLVALLAVGSLVATDKTPAKEDKLLILDPMVIRTEPVGSYAIEIGITINPDTKKVDRMFITGVQDDSDAEEAGLRSGDEILKLDGHSVQEFDAILRKDSPLGRILRDRDPGDPLKLEIRVRRTQSYTLRAQRHIAR